MRQARPRNDFNVNLSLHLVTMTMGRSLPPPNINNGTPCISTQPRCQPPGFGPGVAYILSRFDLWAVTPFSTGWMSYPFDCGGSWY